MTAAVSNRIVFVVDMDGLERTERLAREMGASQTLLDGAAKDALADADAVIVDVDLTTHGAFKALKGILSVGPAEQARVFAVNGERRLEMIYAHIGGATGVLRRPLSKDRLLKHIADRRKASEVVLKPTRVDTSITIAADALGEMFDALVGRDQLDVDGVDMAGDGIAESIEGDGLPDWLDVVRAHHAGTFQHCLIVTGLLTAFAQSTGMGRRDVGLLTQAGLLHDVGKASIPVEILDKPGKLTTAEFALIKTHPTLGFDYLGAQGAMSPEILSAVRSHHEYLDGSGYPDGLRGGRIDDVVRIVTICDVFGALIEHRSYKPPMPMQDAAAVLVQMAGEGKVEMPLVRALARATGVTL